jgi:hypothetical protein
LLGLLLAVVLPTISLGLDNGLKQVIAEADLYTIQTWYTWEETIIQSLIVVYWAITSVMVLRFLRDVYTIIIKIRQSEKRQCKNSNLVLTNDNVPPYTFLNYVFINRVSLEKTPDLLMNHELTHANQWHSFDILVVELTGAFFWFNPIIPIYKQAIQLNHEFLADDGALKQRGNIEDYQRLLLTHLDNSKAVNLSSSLTFSLSKRRFVMMFRKGSKFQLLKKIGAISILVFALFACTDHAGVSSKEMLLYWKYTAAQEETLITGVFKKDVNSDAKPIETKEQYDKLLSIYKHMNSDQKSSVIKLTHWLEDEE